MLTIAFVKLMFYVRMFEDFGNLITLVWTCIEDMIPFLIFMGAFFFFFAIMFEVLGAQFDRDEFGTDEYAATMRKWYKLKDDADLPYEHERVWFGTGRMSTNLINVFRNSLGNIGNPYQKFWQDYHKEHSTLSESYIGFIWFMMIFNQCLMQVQLFNFLIAIVTESHAKVMSMHEVNMFGHKSELNHEYYLTYKFFLKCCRSRKSIQQNHSFDVLFMMAPKDEELVHIDSDWDKFYQKFRKFLYKRTNKDKEKCQKYY